jgi:hypothetical protein
MFDYYDIVTVVAASIPALCMFTVAISVITNANAKIFILASLVIYCTVFLFLNRIGQEKLLLTCNLYSQIL